MRILPDAAGSESRTGLPMPALRPVQAAETVFCAVTTVDARGRLADRSPARVLGWSPGQQLAASILAGVVRLEAVQAGGLTVTKQGHVRLPSETRHAVGLSTGDRVLAVARTDLGVVMVYPMPVVAELLRLHDGAGSTGLPR